MKKEIKYTKLQALFLTVLDSLKIPRHAQVGLFIMLKDDEEQMAEWTVWFYRSHPDEKMIMDKLLDRD